MPSHACSLLMKPPNGPQIIQPLTWTDLRLPYGTFESSDAEEMHAETRDGITYPYPAARESALIWPSQAEWGIVALEAIWESVGSWDPDDRPLQYSTRFCRDPFSMVLPEPDWTGTDDRAPTPGQQKVSRCWPMYVKPTVPLSAQVWHDGAKPVKVVLSEFKVLNWTDPAPVPPS